MARKTLRQLAQEKGWTPGQAEEMKQLLGVNSLGELVDDSDSRLQQKATAPKRQAAPQPQEGAANGMPVMFTEVGQKIDQGLDPVAKQMRLQAQNRLEQKIVHYMHVPSDQLNEEELPDNFGFFSQVRGLELTEHRPSLGGSSSQTPQLTAASTQTSEKTSTMPSISVQDGSPSNTGI